MKMFRSVALVALAGLLAGMVYYSDDAEPEPVLAVDVFDWVPRQHRYRLHGQRVAWAEQAMDAARFAAMDEHKGRRVLIPTTTLERVGDDGPGLERVAGTFTYEHRGITHRVRVEAWLDPEEVAAWDGGEATGGLVGPIIGVSYDTDGASVLAILRLGNSALR